MAGMCFYMFLQILPVRNPETNLHLINTCVYIYIIFEGVSRMLPNVETMIYHLPHRGRARGSKTF